MRKCWIISLSLLLLLSGCGAAETMETVSDEMAAPVMAQPKQIYVELPGEAASPPSLCSSPTGGRSTSPWSWVSAP